MEEAYADSILCLFPLLFPFSLAPEYLLLSVSWVMGLVNFPLEKLKWFFITLSTHLNLLDPGMGIRLPMPMKFAYVLY